MKRFLLIFACVALGVGAWKMIARRADGRNQPASTEVDDETPVVLFRVVDATGQGIAGAYVAGRLTDRVGRCELQVPGGEKATIPVSHDGYCPAEVSVGPLATGARTERWVRLERARTLEARLVVRGTGEPAGGATVRLEAFDGPVDVASPRLATADSDGLVRFEGVPNCHLDLTATRRYVSDPYRIQLVDGRAPDPIVMEARAATHVVVEIVDRDGAPVRGARVLAVGGAATPGVTISDNGLYETDVPEGSECVIDAIDASWARGGLRFTGDGRPERRERIVLTAARDRPDAHELRLRVVDRVTQEAIPGARVMIQFSSPALRHVLAYSEALQIPGMQTDHEGKLVVAVPFDHVGAHATHPGYAEVEGASIPSEAGVLEGIVYMMPEDPSRVVTCRAERPVEIDWTWKGSGEHGAIELSGFRREDKTCEIRYRPKADIARDCVLENVAIGSRDVQLPFYPMGELLVRCSDPDGHVVPRAWVAVDGDGFSGRVRKEDPRGEMLVRDLPAGSADVWVHGEWRGEIGPIACVIPAGGRMEVAARFGPRRALLGTRLTLVDGEPGAGFQVVLLDPAGKPVNVISERFLDPRWGSPMFETFSDGRCYIPLPAQEVSVAFRGVVRVSRSPPWEEWGGPLFGFEKVVVPSDGIVDLDLRLDWSVCVSGLDPDTVVSEFRRGDVVVSWHGKKVRDVGDCMPSAGPLRVTVRRGDRTVELNLPPGPHAALLDRKYSVAR